VGAVRPGPGTLWVQLTRPRDGGPPPSPWPTDPAPVVIGGPVELIATPTPTVTAAARSWPGGTAVLIFKSGSGYRPTQVTDSAGRTWTQVIAAGVSGTTTILYQIPAGAALAPGDTVTATVTSSNHAMVLLSLPRSGLAERATQLASALGTGTVTVPATAAITVVPQIAMSVASRGGGTPPYPPGGITTTAGAAWSDRVDLTPGPAAGQTISYIYATMANLVPAAAVTWNVPAGTNTNVSAVTATFLPAAP
jgi:hypothetical protein